ncbi:MAG TPA: hypothetical protein DEO88_10755 [Syntrophobacteraceae bacterium]|nr:hypothetical protein [Syntrophobacteraceae bacterium]
MRGTLLSLQSTSSLMNRAMTRLSTGKKVNTPLDDPVSYFISMSLRNRAGDLLGRLDSVKEAIQSIGAATNGLNAIMNMVGSAKAVATAALSMDQASRNSYAATFDEIMSQIDTVASDSGYGGLNLLKGQSLKVDFSENSGQSTLTIDGADATSNGLGVSKTSSGGAPATTTLTDQRMGTGNTVSSFLQSPATFTFAGPDSNLSHSVSITVDISGLQSMTATTWEDLQSSHTGDFVIVNSSRAGGGFGQYATSVTGDSKQITATATGFATDPTYYFDAGDTLFLQLQVMFSTPLQRTFGTNNTAAELSNIKVGGTLQTAGVDYNLVTRSGDGKADIVFTSGHGPANGTPITADVTTTTAGGANPWTSTANIQTSLNQLTKATDTLRSLNSQFANCSTILTTRMGFISGLSIILQTGADNLILADMNEEGANMLMLQTRQNLATSSLSLASQAAQGVLRLF